MAKKKITEDRYQALKLVLNNVPINKKGAELLYKSLDISSSTASRVRRSKDFADYVKQGELIRSKKEPKEIIIDHREDLILAKLNRIDERLELIETRLLPKPIKLKFMGRKGGR